MLNRNIEPVMWEIAHEFARWATRAAVAAGRKDGGGCPIQSREEVDAALDIVDFDPLFDTNLGFIDSREFNAWYIQAVVGLIEWEQRLNVGWAAKIIAIYLKTTCYLAGFGREGLKNVIHPPIDNGLINGLKRESWTNPDIQQFLKLLPRTGIISKIDAETYPIYIKVFKLVAQEQGCTLFEVEQFWGS